MKETINSFIELGDKVIEQEEEIEKLNKELESERQIKKEVREYIEKQIPIVKAEIGIANINTSTSELLNYEKILKTLDKVGSDK